MIMHKVYMRISSQLIKKQYWQSKTYPRMRSSTEHPYIQQLMKNASFYLSVEKVKREAGELYDWQQNWTTLRYWQPADRSQSELLYSSSGIRLNAAYTNLSWRRRINKLWWETSRWSRTVWGQREVQEARGRQTAECVLYKNTFSIHEVWSRAK